MRCITGLITAQDLISQLKDKQLGTELLLSSSMIRRECMDFLDDMTVDEVESALNVKLKFVNSDGYEFLDAVMGIEW